jgi:hypothetical protein
LPEGRVFYVFQNIPKATQIVKAEYYFDTDPGVGNGSNLVLSPDDTVTVTSLMPVNSLSNGWHKVGLRTRDNLGIWTTKEERSFFVGPCSTPTPPNAVGWWSMDDATSADPTITDLAGNQPGVIVNSFPRPFNGIFDGVDDYVGMPDNDAWAFGTQNFSIELLASFSSPSGNLVDPGDKIIGQSEGSGAAKKWTLGVGQGQLFLRMANGTNVMNLASTPFVPIVNQWYHLAVTRSGDTIRTFIDGQLAGSQIVPGLVFPDVQAPVTIGWVDFVNFVPDQGYFGGGLDEITLYNRALTQPEIASIATANRSGKCKVLSITTGQIPAGQFGHPYSFNFSASFGQAPYKWTLVSGSLPDGVKLDSNGVLKGTPSVAGEFTIQVRVKDGTNALVQKSFVWKVSVTKPFSNFSIFKSGTTTVPGRNVDYFIQIENLGSEVDTFFVKEFVEPWFSLVRADNPFLIENRDKDFLFSNGVDSIPSIVSWRLLLNPNEADVINYRVKLLPTLLLGKTVKGTAYGYINDIRNCLPVFDGVNEPGSANCNGKFQNGLLNFDQYIKCLDEVRDHANDQFYKCLGSAGPSGPPMPGSGPHDEYTGVHIAQDIQPTVAPIDPNEKLVLAPKYIKPDQLLVYPVHYENVGTIEALDVFIRDTISPFLDLKSLKLISTTGGSLDTANRVVKFDLIGTNLQPDSSGYVLYSMKPKAGLPNGTIIRNRAGIKFEVFQTFMTNETINIIDGLPPTSSMKPLSDTLYQTAIPLRWSGVDSVGELKDYTIFVSVDGGSYTPFLRNTTDTSAFYLGQPGKTYRFICVAEDLAGNFEVQGSVAEAKTFLKVLCANKYFRDADGDGYGSRFVYSYSCTPPSGFLADSLDCDDSRPEVHPGGTEICSLYDENCNGTNNENNVCVTAVNPLVRSWTRGELILVPNPASQELSISIAGFQEGDVDVGIFDPEGREIYHGKIGKGNAFEGIAVKTNRIPNGIYFVKTLTGGKNQVKKLVILH